MARNVETIPASATRRRLLGGLAAAGASAAARTGAAATSFEAWLDDFGTRALRQGVARGAVERGLRGLEVDEKVIELDQRQSSGRISFRRYLARTVNESRIDTGASLLAQNRGTLDRVRARFNVAPGVVTALWGVESSFGTYTGNFRVLNSLATLAWEGRRRALFERELLGGLRIVQRGDVRPEAMTGSWAGAMGQCQFMPTTYLDHAVDFDRDGRADIWSSESDVLASIAGYLSAAGWDGRLIWGREVRPPRAGVARSGLDTRLTLPEWQGLGVRRLDGGPLPSQPVPASLIVTDDGDGPSFLVYENFRTLMVWNRSTNFALAVGILSDRIAAAAGA